MVGNGHSVCVAAEISENILGAAEWRFAVHDPVLTVEFTDEGMKSFRVGKMLQFAVEADLTLGKRVLQSILDLPSKDPSQHILRQKESIAWIGTHPALMVERQSSGGNDAVDVWMVLHGLSPGMEHAEKADSGTEAIRIAGDFNEGLCAGPEQEIVNDLLVLQCQGTEFVRQGEDNMRVRHRQQITRPCLDPAVSCIGLTPRAVPVTT